MAPKPNKPKSQAPRGASQTAPAAAAAASVPPPSLDDLLTSLDKHVKSNEYTQIVKVADQILEVAPGDVDAVQCKVAALIHNDNIDQALSVIESTRNLGLDLSYCKAYCLYRKNCLQEALAALKGLEKTPAVHQLEAQISYRQGDFGICIGSYQNLLQQHKVDSFELKTNIIAAYISGGRSNEVFSLMETMKVTSSSSFELAYNAGCALIERGSYAKAEELLQLAHRIGQEMLIEDEYTDDEVENELAPISVQLAYVRQMQGRIVEAMESYNNLLKLKLADAPSTAVASNNLVALRNAKDMFDSLKKIDKLIEKKDSDQGLKFVNGLEHKLSLRQKEAIGFNRCLLLLHSNKLDQARELVSSLQEKFSGSILVTMLHAALLLKEGKLNQAENMLWQYVEKHPNYSMPTLLVHAQIAALAGHHLAAAESLEHITELQHRPGMVATLVALKEKGGDLQGAEAILDAAIQSWEKHMGEDTSTLEVIMREAASFKLRHKKLEEASDIFLRLSKSSSLAVRAEALIGLVCSTVYTDLGQAELYESQLPALSGQSGLDPIVLESSMSAIPFSGREKQPRVAEDTLPEGVERAKNKNRRKRKRKPRYPKGFDPANPGPPPDPERWLPKRERSTYRPKRKDKRAAHIRGAQGAIAKEKTAVPVGATANGPSTVGSSKPASNVGKGAVSSIVSSETSKTSSSNAQKSKKKSRR
eukprot:c22638_g1_i1 orf=54-2165(+)